MKNSKYLIKLTDDDKKWLVAISDSNESSQRYKTRAQILLSSDVTCSPQMTVKEIAKMYSTTPTTVMTVRKAYAENGLSGVFKNLDVTLYKTPLYINSAFIDIFESDDMLEKAVKNGRGPYKTLALLININKESRIVLSRMQEDLKADKDRSFNHISEIIQKAINDYYKDCQEAFLEEKKSWINWWLIRYYIREEYKALEFSPLCPAVRNYSKNLLADLRSAASPGIFINKYCGKLMRSFFNEAALKCEVSDDRVVYYKELVGTLRENRKGTLERADMFSLVAYLECLQIIYNKNIILHFKHHKPSSAYHGDYSAAGINDEGDITGKILYDISQGLDCLFLISCQQALNHIYTCLYNISLILALPRYLSDINRKKDAQDLCSRIISEVVSINIKQIDSKLDVLQKFYSKILLFDFKCKYGLYKLSAKLTAKYKCPKLNNIIARELMNTPVTFIEAKNQEIKAYITDTVEEIAEKQDTDIKLKRYSLPFVYINRSGLNEIDFDAFFSDNISDIKDFCSKADLSDSYRNNFTKNFKNNMGNLKWFSNTLLGNHTDGLSIFICCYLFFELADWSADAHTIKSSIINKTLSPNELNIASSLLQRIRYDILTGKYKKEEGVDFKPVNNHIFDEILKLFYDDNIFCIQDRLDDFLGQFIKVSRPYYVKHSIMFPFDDKRFHAHTRSDISCKTES